MRTLTAGLVVLGMTVLAVAPAHAQETSTTTGAASIALAVGYIDFGVSGDPNDDCAYIKMSAPSIATVTSGDIRILKSNTAGSICSDAAHTPGTLVSSSDPAETSSVAKLLTMTVKYEDVNGNGHYDANDTLFLDTAATGPLSATNTGANVYSIRLSASAGQPAGSLVFASHSDYGGGTNAVALTSASVTWLERTGGTTFDASDYGYLLPQNGPGFPAGSLIPLGGLRLTANNPNGAFGTSVIARGTGGAPAAPSLTLTSGVPGPGDYTMTLTVADFTLDAVSATPVNAAAHGHIHYFLNDAKCEATCAAGQSYATASTSFTFHGLVAGDKVSAELVNNDHSSLNPVVKKGLTVAAPTTTSSTATTSSTSHTGTGTGSSATASTRSHATSGSSIPALGLAPILVIALVVAVFLTRRNL